MITVHGDGNGGIAYISADGPEFSVVEWIVTEEGLAILVNNGESSFWVDEDGCELDLNILPKEIRRAYTIPR